MPETDAKKQAALKKLQEMKQKMDKLKKDIEAAQKSAAEQAKKAEG